MRKPVAVKEAGSAATDRACGGQSEDERLDLRGLRCPLPVLKTAKRLTALAPGQRIEILADDPLAAVDLPLFCRQEAQTLLAQAPFGHGALRFLIERGPEPPRLERTADEPERP